jgi:hypothetical protein
VRVVAALAEGLGLRAVARVFALDPHPVLAWWGEAAAQLPAFSQSWLPDGQIGQVHLDEFLAVLSERPARGAPPRPARPSRARPLGSGSPSTQKANCWELSTAGDAPSRWRNGWFLTSCSGPGLGAPRSHRWFQGICDRSPHAFGALGPTPSPSSHRAKPDAPLAAPTGAALCAGRQPLSAPMPGPPAASGGVRPLGSRPARLGPTRRAHQDRLH